MFVNKSQDLLIYYPQEELLRQFFLFFVFVLYCVSKIENDFQIMRKKNYTTVQKDTVLNYLKDNPGRHVNARDVYDELKKQEEKIGLTTVYRHLEKLVQEGQVIRSVIDENTPACYEYTGCEDSHCYHFKCIRCGRIEHIHCDEITILENHISNEHNFTIMPRMTVFYGLCEECRKYEEA